MKIFQLFFLSFFLSSIQLVQAQSNIVAELNNVNVNNDSQIKTIKIKFSSCLQAEFDNITTTVKEVVDFKLELNKYSIKEQRGFVILTSLNKITTQKIEELLKSLKIVGVSLNNKKIIVDNLSNYEFTKVERNISQNNLEN